MIYKDLLLDIYTSIRNAEECENYSLMTGNVGEALFLYHYFLETRQNEVKLLMESKLNNATRSIENSDTFDFSLCEGIIEYAWFIKYLINAKIIDTSFSNIIDEIKSIAHNHFIENFSSDYLYGTIGYGHFLSDNITSSSDKKRIQDLFEIIKMNGEYSDNKEYIFWKSSIPNNRINMGLAHGLPSILILLVRIFELNNDNEIKKMIEKCYLLMESTHKASVTVSQFPDFIDAPSPFNRLAWCYGDLGVLWSLYQANKYISQPVYNQKQLLKNMLVTTNRRSIESTGIDNCYYCHGSSGLTAIYSSLSYKVSEKFMEISNYWNNWTYAQTNNPNGIDNQQFIFKKGNNSLLEGNAGIGLSILANSNKIHSTFNKFFLW